MTWETGGVTRHEGLNAALGAEEDWALVTMLLIGYPGDAPRSRRTAVSNLSRWFGPDDRRPLQDSDIANAG